MPSLCCLTSVQLPCKPQAKRPPALWTQISATDVTYSQAQPSLTVMAFMRVRSVLAITHLPTGLSSEPKLWIPSAHCRAGELLDTLPPGVDELVAISKVVSFLKAPEYAKFTRIIFDTAPTGHTLRLLTLPDFIDATIGKVRVEEYTLKFQANLQRQGDDGASLRSAHVGAGSRPSSAEAYTMHDQHTHWCKIASVTIATEASGGDGRACSP